MPGLLKHWYPDSSHCTIDLRQLWRHNPEDDMMDTGHGSRGSRSRSPSPALRGGGDLFAVRVRAASALVNPLSSEVTHFSIPGSDNPLQNEDFFCEMMDAGWDAIVCLLCTLFGLVCGAKYIEHCVSLMCILLAYNWCFSLCLLFYVCSEC